MTEEAAPSVEVTAAPVTPPAPANAASVIPGNPGQTQATVKRFLENPAEAEYVFSQLGYDQRAKQALDLAHKTALEAATFRAALEYGIAKEDLPLIADSTPEGVMSRAALLAARTPKPDAAAPAPDTTEDAASSAKSAGSALPAAQGQIGKIEPTAESIRQALIAMRTANPTP